MKRTPKHPVQRYEARARIAKALAHPARLMMLDVLADREWCVCELTDLTRLDQSTVSKHLSVLKHAGIVTDRKEGTKTFFRLKICCLQGLWECIESVLKDNLKTQQAAIGV
ncbi:MAG: winged helix-turn-helix transcriptional regulator [Phycisphaerae bacterium]|nr:winged helix-turn-helix transcriptional regulator [Phycisphaerae bacterium]